MPQVQCECGGMEIEIRGWGEVDVYNEYVILTV